MPRSHHVVSLLKITDLAKLRKIQISIEWPSWCTTLSADKSVTCLCLHPWINRRLQWTEVPLSLCLGTVSFRLEICWIPSRTWLVDIISSRSEMTKLLIILCDFHYCVWFLNFIKRAVKSTMQPWAEYEVQINWESASKVFKKLHLTTNNQKMQYKNLLHLGEHCSATMICYFFFSLSE
jgi:hypothetical protein